MASLSFLIRVIDKVGEELELVQQEFRLLGRVTDTAENVLDWK